MGRWLGKVYLAPILAIVLLDFLSKSKARDFFGGVETLIPGILEIMVLRNYGFFQGLFDRFAPERTVLLATVLVALIIAGLVWWARSTQQAKTMRHLGIACMIGGALANGMDRLIHGYVLDFLAIGPLGVYNIADVAVIGGAGLMLRDFWRKQPEEQAIHASHSL